MNITAKLFIYIEFECSKMNQKNIRDMWKDADIYFSPKDSVYYEFESDKKIEKHRENDYCNIRYEVLQEEKSLADILVEFLQYHREQIESSFDICSDLKKRIHVCIYPEQEQYTMAFSHELLRLVLSLNLEIGTTILHLG